MVCRKVLETALDNGGSGYWKDFLHIGLREVTYAHSSSIDTPIEKLVRPVLESGTYLLSLGGDRNCSKPLRKAVAAVHGPLASAHFDAHLDVERSEDRVQDHGAMFGYAIETGVLPRKSPFKSVFGPLLRTKATMAWGINVKGTL
ncbi:arginase family protein [Ruegeria arenilitoris]|uniref:arginase family protein n=1 Tax=Ruegeria arenilitoris TaxID=1173585 RepID=UPI001C2C0EC3